jgi:glycine cleavage system transcriptional repressor
MPVYRFFFSEPSRTSVDRLARFDIKRSQTRKNDPIYPNIIGNLMNKVIVSVLGHDRPGIVAAVANVLYQENCNIENVSQTILQTEFAGSFIVTLPGELAQEALYESLSADLAPLKMHVHVAPLAGNTAAFLPGTSEPFVITTKGPDRKGLVAGISEVIACYGANITNLKAVFKGGNEPGANIMIYEVDIPVAVDAKAFYHDLKEKAAALSLTVSIQHRNIFEAINRI